MTTATRPIPSATAILAALGRGERLVDVARRFNCTAPAVAAVRADPALALRRERDRLALEALELDGATIAEAAEFAGCDAARVLELVGDVGSGRPSPALALALSREGLKGDQVAAALGVPESTAYRWINRALALEAATQRRPPPPWSFTCRWPAGPFTPAAACRCDVEPIPRESAWYCPVCSATGWDDHPDMRPPRDAPAPERRARSRPLKVRWSVEARAAAATLKATAKALTRRERRALEFGKAEADRARALYARLAGTGAADQFEREGAKVERLLGEGRDERADSWAGAAASGRRIAAHPSGL